jgi:hypothetical protein
LLHNITARTIPYNLLQLTKVGFAMKIQWLRKIIVGGNERLCWMIAILTSGLTANVVAAQEPQINQLHKFHNSSITAQVSSLDPLDTVFSAAPIKAKASIASSTNDAEISEISEFRFSPNSFTNSDLRPAPIQSKITILKGFENLPVTANIAQSDPSNLFDLLPPATEEINKQVTDLQQSLSPPKTFTPTGFEKPPTITKIAQSNLSTPFNLPSPTANEIDKKIIDLQQRLKTLEDNTSESISFSSPGRSANVPTAWGASFGDVGVGLGFQGRTRFTRTSDGGAGIGFGLGDPYRSVGFDVGININDLGINGNEGFAGRGSFDFVLHRVLPDNFRVAVGLENALVWGGTDTDTSVYAVVSKTVKLKDSKFKNFSRLYLNAGVGNGRFRSERNVINDVNSVGVFGSMALRVVDQMNVFTEWTGQDLNVGLSIAPFSDIPFVITPIVSDLTGNAGDGTRFGFGVSYGFKF